MFGAGRVGGDVGSSGGAADAPAAAVTDARSPTEPEVRRLCRLATAAAGVRDGHLAVEFVNAERIAELNARYQNDAMRLGEVTYLTAEEAKSCMTNIEAQVQRPWDLWKEQAAERRRK